MKNLLILNNNLSKYYDVFELFNDLDHETVDLFKRADFDMEDLCDLKTLQFNIYKLDKAIDTKISSIYENVINEGLDNE